MSLYQALYVFISHDVDRERTTLLVEKNFHSVLESLANIFAWKTNVFTSPQTKQTFCKFGINFIHVRIRKQLFRENLTLHNRCIQFSLKLSTIGKGIL